MIALVAGDEQLRKGPVLLALAHAGFEACETATPEEAARRFGGRAGHCVVVVDSRSLDAAAGRASWRDFLNDHQHVAAVVVARCGEGACAGEVAQAPHRIVLERPFDAAAVVGAALRASATARHRAQRVPGRVPSRSKYAS